MTSMPLDTSAHHKANPPRKTGRPRSFDRGAALGSAMLVFWKHGYEATSITDLTAAMGISAPSLYAAYGNKKRLFLEAVQLYAGDPAALGRSLAEAPSAAAAVRSFLTAAAVIYTGKTTPPGCLLASATAGVSDESIDMQLAVSQVRRRITGYVKARIAHDIENETLPADTDADALSGGVMAIAQGMSVLARDGLRRPALLAIAEAYLRSWPTQAAPDLG
jgi:AcrR family transcriptional regulator